MLLTDKYIPKLLDNINIHSDIANLLKQIIKSQNMPHLLLYGINYSGKNTILNSLLYSIYGESSLVRNNNTIDIKISNTSNLHTINYIQNKNFIIYNMTNTLSYDKYIIKELTTFFTNSQNINSYISESLYRLIIITNAEYLSLYAQSFLRRTMEKYSEYCRFILLTNQLSALIEPIQSRCLSIRIPIKPFDKLFEHVKSIVLKENYDISDDIIKQIIIENNHQLYDILIILQQYNLNNDCSITTSNEIEWKELIKLTVLHLFTKYTINDLTEYKKTIYELLITNIKSNDIFTEILHNIFIILNNCKTIPDKTIFKLKKEYINCISNLQIQMTTGNKNIFYFEKLFIEIILLNDKYNINNNKLKLLPIDDDSN